MASLEAFVRVVDEGGFAAAARALHLSPAMVSKHIRELERRLGVSLLHRTTRRVNLTDAGLTFYREVKPALQALDDAARAQSGHTGEVHGTLRVTVPVAFSERYIAPLLPEFLRRHPRLGIDLVCDDKVVELVQGRFDLALRIGRLPDSSLIARKLAPIEVVVCGAPSYLAERGMPRTLDDLADHAKLEYDYQWTSGGWAFRADKTSDDMIVRFPKVKYRSNNAEVLRALALEGFGLVQLPNFIVGDDLANGGLIQVLEQYQPVERWIQIVHLPGQRVSASVRAFGDFLATALRKPSWLRP